jgi:hypothetical protein
MESVDNLNNLQSRMFPNPILHSETSIVSKGDTIPEEDRVYDKDKSKNIGLLILQTSGS